MLSKRLRPTALTFLLLALAAAVAARSNLRRWFVGWPTDTERRLQGRLTKVQFDNVPFDAALERFARSTRLSFDIDWPALESQGISRKTRVRLRLEDVTVAIAMDELLRAGMRSGRANPPVYELTPDGHILVGGGSAASAAGDARLGRTTVTRLYDLRDVVADDLRWRQDDQGKDRDPAWDPVAAHAQMKTAPRAVDSPAMDLMDDYARYISDGTFWGDPDLPQPAVTMAGRFLVVTALPSQQADIKWLLDELRRSSRPVRQVDSESGRRRKERTRVGTGLFAR